jgi:hypothetical protein
MKKGYGMFDDCVLSLYNNRKKAREAGHTGLSYVYKLLMNSLFGRLGIDPNRSVAEICDIERYKLFINEA